MLEYHKWLVRYSTDYIDLITRRAKCVCCGATPVELDHISGREYIYQPSSNRATGKIGNPYYRNLELEKGLLQPLCTRCNKSKRSSSYCNIHRKYLGIWNHLPKLDNLDEIKPSCEAYQTMMGHLL